MVPVTAAPESNLLPIVGWSFAVLAAIAAVVVLGLKSRFKPGYATAVLGCSAIVYATIAWLDPKPNIGLAVGFIAFAFALMFTEIASIGKDTKDREKQYGDEAAQRDNRHAELLTRFERVFSLQLDTIRISKESANSKPDSLRQHLLDMSGQLVAFLRVREVDDPMMKPDPATFRIGYQLPTPMEMLQQSTDKSNAKIEYDRSTIKLYEAQFPAIIDRLVQEAQERDKSYNGPYYSLIFSPFDIQSIALALERLAMSLDEDDADNE